MSNPRQYTVGWICALSTEYTAAQAFLDEKHEAPDNLSSADNNHYTCGKIGKHHIVIAVLPDGEYGLSSAATVAKDMTHSFPNVRIGLMVGIGGGAPTSKNDIRLGDVVVSAPRDGKGGVFQYDFGKTIQGQSFEATGILNQPPTALRTALSGLRSQYELEGHQLEESISTALQKKPRLRKKYQRPDPGSDRLFQSDFIHSGDIGESCMDTCLQTGQSSVIIRPERPSDEDDPVIHYGLIASANNLMKDASIRDKLAAEHDVLCFEMEAAGLINHFPCLVIRGICDYSDSHKNKEWQGYAAMMAAAYARDLLHELSPNRVEKEMTIQEALSSVNEIVLRTEANVATISSQISKKETLEALDWLTPNNQGTHQSDHLRRRQPGTGEWLIESSKYQDWRTNQGKKTAVFWLHSEQKVEDLLASILKQLAVGKPKIVIELFKKHGSNGTRPSLNELIRALRSVAASYSRIFIVVDAVDECQKVDDCQNVFLFQLFSLQQECSMNLFATCRPIPEIEERFVGDRMDIRAHDSDLQKYLNGRILQAGSALMKRFEEQIKKRIIEVADGMFLLAQLHFDSIKTKMTAKQVLTTLKSLSSGVDAYDLAYDEAKGRIKNQDRDSFKLAMDVLMWITCAKRPFKLRELQLALATQEEGEPVLYMDSITEATFIVSVCAGLVTVDEESQIIRLIHHTTQDYFKRKHNNWFYDSESKLATTCLTILSTHGNKSSPTSPIRSEHSAPSLWEDEVRSLYIYAAWNWGYHARKAETDITKRIMKFLENGKEIETSAEFLNLPTMTSLAADLDECPIRNVTAMHLAAHFGLDMIAKKLLELKFPIDQIDSYGATPLMWAASEGQAEMIEFLLQHGVQFNLQHVSGGRTALSYAAEHGCERSVQLLLEKKADTELQDEIGYAPLFYAIGNRNERIVRLLLDNGADVNCQDNYDTTPLLRSLHIQDERIVRILLDGGADVNFQRGQTPTALSLAARLGNEKAVQLLLEMGADVNLRDGVSKFALKFARASGQECISALLPADGADSGSDWEDANSDSEIDGFSAEIDSEFADSESSDSGFLREEGQLPGDDDDTNLSYLFDRLFGQTALFSAAISGNEKTVQLLLDMGADINLQDIKGQTSVTSTIKYGTNAILALISENKSYFGLQYDAQELADSAGQKSEEIIQILLDRNPNLNLRDYKGRTPLFSAVTHCADEIVRTMLENGALCDWQDTTGRTPLFNAIRRGHEGILQLLLDNGAHINLQDAGGQTPLIHAMLYAGERCDDVLRLDFHHGFFEMAEREGASDLDTIVTGAFDTGLKAAKDARLKTIRILLDRGADPALRDENGRTALSFATQSGEKPFIEPLLDREDNIDFQDKKFRTALMHALRSKAEILSVIDLMNQGPDSGDFFLHMLKIGALDKTSAKFGMHILKPLEETIEFLLEFGANIELRDQDGQTALFYAAKCGDQRSVQLLLQRGVDLHVEDHNGQTPLFIAIAHERIMIIQLLLEAGADCNMANKAGQTPLIHAVKGQHKSSLQRLLELGVNPDVTDEVGRTPLSYAAESWDLTIMKLLLEKGASPDLQDSHGRTPISHGAGTLESNDVPLFLKKALKFKSNQSSEALLEFIVRADEFNLLRKPRIVYLK
ncbi:ankyrin, partial [Penicillium malachiteum]